MTTYTVYPGSEPPEPVNRRDRQMPEGWRPTPPPLEQRADTAQKYADHIAGQIAEAERVGDRQAVFDLTDRQSRELRKADQYRRLAALQKGNLEPPSDASPPAKTFVIGG